jgi:hypothetical protein
MTTEPVLLSRDGPIVTLTLNRADRRNALDSTLIGALTALVSSLTSEALARPVSPPEAATVQEPGDRATSSCVRSTRKAQHSVPAPSARDIVIADFIVLAPR